MTTTKTASMPGLHSPARCPRPESRRQPNQINSTAPPWDDSGGDQRVFRCGGRAKSPSPPEFPHLHSTVAVVANPQPLQGLRCKQARLEAVSRAGAGAPEEEQAGKPAAAAAAYDYEGHARWATTSPMSSCCPTSLRRVIPVDDDPEVMAIFRAAAFFRIGDGTRALFWTDAWLPGRKSVQHVVPILHSFVKKSNITVAAALQNNRWDRDLWSSRCNSLAPLHSAEQAKHSLHLQHPVLVPDQLPQHHHHQIDRAANPLRFDARTINFSINTCELVVAGLGKWQCLPKHLADIACKLFFAGNSLLLGIFFICSTYRKPRSSNMPAIQGWLHLVLGAKDFIHLIFCVLLVTSQLHLKIAALPVFCWALDHVARFLRPSFAHPSFYRGLVRAK